MHQATLQDKREDPGILSTREAITQVTQTHQTNANPLQNIVEDDDDDDDDDGKSDPASSTAFSALLRKRPGETRLLVCPSPAPPAPRYTDVSVVKEQEEKPLRNEAVYRPAPARQENGQENRD